MKISNLSKQDIIKLFIGTIFVLSGIFAWSIFMIVNNAHEKIIESDFTSNVKFEGQKQLIDITSGGGFNPKITVARAGVETILRFQNNGQIDCSSSVDLPELGIKNEIIALGGENTYEIKSPKIGEFKGSCAMGMYDFRITFK